VVDIVPNTNYKTFLSFVVAAICCLLVGCGADAPPDLTAPGATTLISQRWSHDELNHLSVVFHSDTLVECGVSNGLWKLVETVDRGYTRRAYQLTEKGSKVLFAINLSDSGKRHELTLRGPYSFEITNISPGAQPDTRNVQLHWQVDWDKAPADLKACLPKFELSGSEVALFKLYGPDWRFLSYLKPDDPSMPAPATSAVLDKMP